MREDHSPLQILGFGTPQKPLPAFPPEYTPERETLRPYGHQPGSGLFPDLHIHGIRLHSASHFDMQHDPVDRDHRLDFLPEQRRTGARCSVSRLFLRLDDSRREIPSGGGDVDRTS